MGYYAKYYVRPEDRKYFTIFKTANEAREAALHRDPGARDIKVGTIYDKNSSELLGYIVTYTVTRTL